MTLLFALIFVASRTCANKGDIEADQAVAVARQQIDFRPDGHNVRFMRRGVNQRPFWAVSLWRRGRGRLPPDHGRPRRRRERQRRGDARRAHSLTGAVGARARGLPSIARVLYRTEPPDRVRGGQAHIRITALAKGGDHCMATSVVTAPHPVPPSAERSEG
jgi:hypothetical protein